MNLRNHVADIGSPGPNMKTPVRVTAIKWLPEDWRVSDFLDLRNERTKGTKNDEWLIMSILTLRLGTEIRVFGVPR